MTTSADRILLRWVPLAVFLAVVTAVALSVGPHPFGFHSWPKAPAPRPVERVVRAAPRSARVPVAARHTPSESRAADDGTAMARRDAVRRPQRAPARPKPRQQQEHPQAPREPKGTGSKDGGAPAPQAPSRTPVAQGPRRRPTGVHAKRGPGGDAEVYAADAGRTPRWPAQRGRGRGRGRGHGYGHGRH